MRKVLRVALLGLVIVGVAFVVSRALRPAQPYYAGRSLYSWVVQHTKANMAVDYRARKEAEMAIHHIGTNALPTLLVWIGKQDSLVKMRLIASWPFGEEARHTIHWESANDYQEEAVDACGVLKTMAKPIVPDLISFLTNSEPSIRFYAAAALAQIGPAAEDAIPALIQSLADIGAQPNASVALRSIGAKPEVVVPALIGRLLATDWGSRRLAMQSLAQFGADAKAAVPNLLKFLTDPDINLRLAATNALKRIDPEAAAKAGVK